VKNPQHSIVSSSVLCSSKSSRLTRKKTMTLKIPLVRDEARLGDRARSVYGCVTPANKACFQEKQSEDSKMDEFNFEEQFFAALIARGCDVSVYLINGVQLGGQVVCANESCVLLKENDFPATLDNTLLIFKTAISSVVPRTVSEIASAAA